MASLGLGSRDHRIDFLRGLALLSIFINHIPGNILEPFTHKNYGLTDSAELFVLLAGIAAAFAYFPRFQSGAAMLATAKVVKRSATLYVAHVASSMAGIGVFCFAAITFAHPELLQEINIGPLIAEPAKGLFGIASMGHQIGYHNILPMYVCLLLVLPLIMALALTGLGFLIAASLTVYAMTQVFGWNLPNYPTEGGWFFNPFAWQIIFVTGFVIGVRILRGQTPVPFVRPLWWAALAYIIWAGIFHRFNLYGTILPEIPFLPHNFQINEKPWVSGQRLLHIWSLAYVVGHSPIMRVLAWLPAGNPLTTMGRHALPVFWVGTLLSMVGQVLMMVFGIGLAAQLTYLTAGFAVQYVVAFGLDWVNAAEKKRKKSQPPRPEMAATPIASSCTGIAATP